MTTSPTIRRIPIAIGVILVLIGGVAFAVRSGPDVKQDIAPTAPPPKAELQSDDDANSQTRESSMRDVLDLAERALDKMDTSLNDYTATFVKQQRDDAGKLSERNEMEVKIHTRHRNESNDAPMRIYIKFKAPEGIAGREVIWGKDLNDGLMAVHETSMLLSWKTIWLDPTGMLAMQGQKFPIYEIGLSRLTEQLLERGKKDLDNPDVSVTITKDHEYYGRNCELIQATRSKPGGGKDDFSLAEIIFDPEELLVLSYRSFGWPEKEGGELPLLESYEYRDLKTNVGLTDSDFDVTNEAYQFP
ncbi:DUF1571 domain-containing protein [Rhodopirellula sp. MGV]|uniref:DUF1571 domain-containing protein n=1 Tax=Rhodopirellula sp. MGV TaxID=2023130 RepID=UPI000B960873|nr:DUF1571 domain-containing protein [Rhodopirellula sp. MGV]OYP36689.1 hypothetical protein CGZ80_07645 [Rhodopirellula sp. MGV]PNY38225.1 DUF1571 domain-containing protein [Rhodopirellula baltica]